jgi:hypothetical protein
MTTSIKTVAVAAKGLEMQVQGKLASQNKTAEKLYKKSKKQARKQTKTKDEIKKAKAESRIGNKFVPRKSVSGENAKLNLYPLVKGDYTGDQVKLLKKTLKNLLVELYKEEPFFKLRFEGGAAYLNSFVKHLVTGLKKDGALAKISFPTQKERDFYLDLCRREKGHSLLDYVTFQENPKGQKICIINIHSEILKAVVDKKTYKKICKKEKEVYFAGRLYSRLNKEEMEKILTDKPCQSIIRYEGPKALSEKQKYIVLENGHLITSGAPPLHAAL